MTLHPNTFDYLQPTLEQVATMQQARFATTVYAALTGAIAAGRP